MAIVVKEKRPVLTMYRKRVVAICMAWGGFGTAVGTVVWSMWTYLNKPLAIGFAAVVIAVVGVCYLDITKHDPRRDGDYEYWRGR